MFSWASWASSTGDFPLIITTDHSSTGDHVIYWARYRQPSVAAGPYIDTDWPAAPAPPAPPLPLPPAPQPEPLVLSTPRRIKLR